MLEGMYLLLDFFSIFAFRFKGRHHVACIFSRALDTVINFVFHIELQASCEDKMISLAWFTSGALAGWLGGVSDAYLLNCPFAKRHHPGQCLGIQTFDLAFELLLL